MSTKYYYKGIPINYLTYNGTTEANDVSGSTLYITQFPGKDTTTYDTIQFVRPVDFKYSILNNIGVHTKRTSVYIDISNAINTDVSLNSYINTTNLGFTPTHISAILIGGGGGGGGSGGGKNNISSINDKYGGLGGGGAGGGQAFLYKYAYSSNLTVRCGTGGTGGVGGQGNSSNNALDGVDGNAGNASYIKDSGTIIVSANGGSGGPGGNAGSTYNNGVSTPTGAGGNASGPYSYTNTENNIVYTGDNSPANASLLTTLVNRAYNSNPEDGNVAYLGYDANQYTNMPTTFSNINTYVPSVYGRGGIGGSIVGGSYNGNQNIVVSVIDAIGNTNSGRTGSNGNQGFIRIYLLYE